MGQFCEKKSSPLPLWRIFVTPLKKNLRNLSLNFLICVLKVVPFNAKKTNIKNQGGDEPPLNHQGGGGRHAPALPHKMRKRIQRGSRLFSYREDILNFRVSRAPLMGRGRLLKAWPPAMEIILNQRRSLFTFFFFISRVIFMCETILYQLLPDKRLKLSSCMIL